MRINCSNCEQILAKYLCDLPSVWRSQLVKVICEAITADYELSCADIKDCETVTSLSEFTQKSSILNITFKDEDGKEFKRGFNIDIILNNALNEIDPKCLMTQEKWNALTYLQKVQAIVSYDSTCRCCTTTSSTTTSTTIAPFPNKLIFKNYTPYSNFRVILKPNLSNVVYIDDSSIGAYEEKVFNFIDQGINPYSTLRFTHTPDVDVLMDVYNGGSYVVGTDPRIGDIDYTFMEGKKDITVILTPIPVTTTSTSTTTTQREVITTTSSTTSTTTKAPCPNVTDIDFEVAVVTTTTTTTVCECPTGYTKVDNDCVKEESMAADVSFSNYCLAPSKISEYSQYFTRIYNTNFQNSSIALFNAPVGEVFAQMTNAPQWRSTDALTGPMNRAGVWIDSDCDGTKDALGGTISTIALNDEGDGYTNGTYTNVHLNFTGPYLYSGAKANITVADGKIASLVITDGGTAYSTNDELTPDLPHTTPASIIVTSTVNQQATIAYNYNNTGAARTVYVGIGADNQFVLKVNGNEIAHTTSPLSQENFKIWHVFPVIIKEGLNYFNVVATGSATVNDAIGMTIYDNLASEIMAATNDNQLDVLFTSSSLIGQHIDVATCQEGWILDTSGGQGNYICRRTVVNSCGSI